MTAANPLARTETPGKLGLGLLIALVVGSILGSGIFGLPQNMAVGAGAGAILIGWLITGAGMFMLARVYQSLATRKPELNNGVYAYARALSGDYVGFNSAWGYWISAWVGNVGYLVAAFGTWLLFPGFWRRQHTSCHCLCFSDVVAGSCFGAKRHSGGHRTERHSDCCQSSAIDRVYHFGRGGVSDRDIQARLLGRSLAGLRASSNKKHHAGHGVGVHRH